MTDPSTDITLSDMRQRHAQLAADVLRTPVVRCVSTDLAQRIGAAEIWLKLECFQHTGTFKARGALSVARGLPKGQGITAASAGNHAIAAAWAASRTGVSARVVMQSNANPFRIAAARALGAEVVLKDPGAPTFAEAERLVAEEGRAFIHPFEGRDTSLGTAGVGLELVEDAPPLDAVIVAVGGGGLISGVAAAIKALSPSTAVFGVEPEGADSMSQSLRAGAPVTLERVQTIADSLAPPMALPFSFGLCRAHVDAMVTVSDTQICAGLALFQQQAKLAVEPAAGATLAAAAGPLRKRLEGKRIALVVCGANIDSAGYAEALRRGAAGSG